MEPGDYDEDGYPVGQERSLGLGSAFGINGRDGDQDAVQRLREVVAEVTRGRIPVPVRRGPGF